MSIILKWNISVLNVSGILITDRKSLGIGQTYQLIPKYLLRFIARKSCLQFNLLTFITRWKSKSGKPRTWNKYDFLYFVYFYPMYRVSELGEFFSQFWMCQTLNFSVGNWKYLLMMIRQVYITKHWAQKSGAKKKGHVYLHKNVHP